MQKEKKIPNKKGIDLLLTINEENSKIFRSQQEERRIYRKRHGTEIAALKCMDGRINLPFITQTPMGIIQPYRNLGGRFHLGWPFFQKDIESWKKYGDLRERDSLVLVTYHFSRGSKHRGCAGHGYDTVKAREFASNLKKEFDVDFGSPSKQSRTKLFSIQVGIETDREALVLHGENGESIDLSEVNDASGDNVYNLLISLYPKMFSVAPNVIDDFLPLVRGNISHVLEVKESGRPIQEAEHHEFVLGVGRGFGWLHLPNKALIVGPWEDNLSDPIAKAAGVIRQNLKEGKLNGNKAVLLTSGVYRDADGEEPFLAKRKSLYLRDVALGVIKKDFKELLPHLEILVTTVDLTTWKLNVIDRH